MTATSELQGTRGAGRQQLRGGLGWGRQAAAAAVGTGSCGFNEGQGGPPREGGEPTGQRQRERPRAAAGEEGCEARGQRGRRPGAGAAGRLVPGEGAWPVAGSLAGGWGPKNLALALSDGRALAEF